MKAHRSSGFAALNMSRSLETEDAAPTALSSQCLLAAVPRLMLSRVSTRARHSNEAPKAIYGLAGSASEEDRLDLGRPSWPSWPRGLRREEGPTTNPETLKPWYAARVQPVVRCRTKGWNRFGYVSICQVACGPETISFKKLHVYLSGRELSSNSNRQFETNANKHV